jgi:aminodeoxyfutalosine deaminase
MITDVIDTGGNLMEIAGLEQYSGILVPGFINAHCHLELSHLKGKISEKKGLGGFLGEINRIRNNEEFFDDGAMKKADQQMQHSGTVAVGDVSNSVASLEVKLNSRLYYHTFSEAFGFHPSRAEKAFRIARYSEDIFVESGLTASLTPHSAYSVSESLFHMIKEKAATDNSILSIHNQESPAEEMFFKSCSGPIFHHLQNTLGLDVSHCKPRQENVLNRVLPFLPEGNNLLLVHNTFTSPDDIKIIKVKREMENTYFVLCPNSNVYIEDQLPPVLLFKQENLNICIGTDSLASNHHLSVLHEMITLQQNFPEITLQELVTWACLNGARALGTDNRFGSFERGKNPGINLITGADLQHLKLTSASRVRVLQVPA